MVRVTKSEEIVIGNQARYYEYAGREDDTKPTGSDICTGSLFLEVDTGDVYAYDEEASAGSEWSKICSLGGGS